MNFIITKWKKLLALIVGVFVISTVYAQITLPDASHAELDINLIKDKEFINDLRTADSIVENKKKVKIYNASEKRLFVENTGLDKSIELKLNSSYVVSGLIASDDTKVAEIFLINYKNIDLFEDVRFFNIKNDYQEIEKILRFKYGVERKNCNLDECFDYTEWIEFQNLGELPHKNIRIGIFTKTEIRERIEWIPRIEGFDILEWAAWDVSTATWVQARSVSAEDSGPSSIFFTSDGTRMYMTGHAGDEVNEYSLSTAWDISTETHVRVRSVSDEELGPDGLFFKPDGTKMYVTGYVGDDVNEYNLSTAWDISSETLNQTRSVVAEEAGPRGIFFKPDGTKMYIIGTQVDEINEYNLSTPWDISSETHVQARSIADEVDYAGDIFFKSDGTKMYTVGYNDNEVNEYSLSTPWDISTETHVQFFDLSDKDTNIAGITFSPDGTRMYVCGTVGKEINEYSLPIEDTCTYSSPGDWDVLYSDNCYVTSETYVLGDFNLIYDGAGSFNLQATLKCDDLNGGTGAEISAENATAQIDIY